MTRSKRPRRRVKRSTPCQARPSRWLLTWGGRALLLFKNLGSSIPVPFVVVLVFWLCIIFASFGLFAPRNATVCALSVAGAIFLILELGRSHEASHA